MGVVGRGTAITVVAEEAAAAGAAGEEAEADGRIDAAAEAEDGRIDAAAEAAGAVRDGERSRSGVSLEIQYLRTTTRVARNSAF